MAAKGCVIVLKDSDDDAPPPAKPVRQGDPGQGSSRDGRVKEEKDDDGGGDDFSFRNKNGGVANVDGPTLAKLGSNSTAQLHPKDDGEERAAAMPPASVMTRLILIMVWRKLIRNPNTYSSLIGVVWSLVSYR